MTTPRAEHRPQLPDAPLHIERIDGFDGVREWDGLAIDGMGGIFATPAWNRIWWTHYGRDRELLVHRAVAADGTLAAALPFYAWRQRPRVIRFLGHGPGDELGPVHATGEHALAARALREALAGLDWDVFFGEQLPGGTHWEGMLDGTVWRRESSPVLHVPAGGWEEYLEARSSNFRQQLRHRERRLARAGRVEVRLANERTLDRDLDVLFALHRARWSGRPSDFSDTPFHRELARAALERGWLRLRLLELDGRPLAAWHGFMVGRVANYYQAGRDPAYERFSVGFVLLAASIRAAIEEGATEYRFGRGDEPFKLRFAAHDPGLVTVIKARGLRGALAYRAALAARAGRHLVRR